MKELHGLRKLLIIATTAAPLAVMLTAGVAGALTIPGNFSADKVLGQPDFSHNVPNRVKAAGIFASGGETRSDFVAVDTNASPNRIYVSDTGNNRVLGWHDATAFSNGAAADLVIGQPDFNSYWANNGGVSASSLNSPTGVAVDSAGNLYVGDSGNFRVLEYTNPFAACAGKFPCVGGPADAVFGQCGSFTVNDRSACATTGVSADTLGSCCPPGTLTLFVDRADNLWVLDAANNRALEFFRPIPMTGGTPGKPGAAGDTTADKVFGQNGSFTGSICNENKSAPTADTLCFPVDVTVDKDNNVWITDYGNQRALEYENPSAAGGGTPGKPGSAGDTTADLSFGQGGSFTSGSNPMCYHGQNPDTLCFPSGIVVDSDLNVFIAESGTHRVLEYDDPLAPGGGTPGTPGSKGDTTADMVFGQGGYSGGPYQNFTSGVCYGNEGQVGGTPASPLTNRPNVDGLCSPEGLALDTAGDLFVGDEGNSRVLKYLDPLAAGGGTPGVPGSAGDVTADAVLGQGNFDHGAGNLIDASGIGGFNGGGTRFGMASRSTRV